MCRSRTSRSRFPVLFFLATSMVLLTVQHVSSQVLRDQDYRPLQWRGLRYYVDGWSQFDGPEYLRIVDLGYSYTPGVRSNIVWFPLYPMLVRAATTVISDPLVAGIAVTLLAGLLAVTVYWRWLEERGFTGRALVISFLVLALYPYGWYLYGVVHSDALFLALLVSAFLLVERRHLVAAGAVAALATATRPTGMALIPALIAFGFERDGVLSIPEGATGWVARFRVPIRFDRSRLRAATFGPFLSLLGLGSWMAYLWVRWGDPIAFVTNQRVYHPGGRPLLKGAFVHHWLTFSESPRIALTTAGQALVVLFVVLMVPRVCRRLGFAYGLFLVVLVAIPTVSTEDFMGTGRYLMAAFPAFAVWGEELAERPAAAKAWLGTSAALLTFLAFGFSRSWYLT